jgi:hypothetical protein
VSYGESFVLTLFTRDPHLARLADQAGIDRIGVDLEVVGKVKRQGHLKTWISDHQIADLPALRQAVRRGALFARTNPVYPGLEAEIDQLIQMGVQVLMLPYFTTVAEAETFIRLVNGRAEVSLLVETAAAAARIDQLACLPGVAEIHIGLNDLYLSLGLKNHFELLVSPLLEMLSQQVLRRGVPFGFGGVGRLGDTRLPVSPDLNYAQYPRLHADRALVSRVFLTPDYRELDLAAEVANLRRRLDEWASAPEAEIQKSRAKLREIALSLQ